MQLLPVKGYLLKTPTAICEVTIALILYKQRKI